MGNKKTTVPPKGDWRDYAVSQSTIDIIREAQNKGITAGLADKGSKVPNWSVSCTLPYKEWTNLVQCCVLVRVATDAVESIAAQRDAAESEVKSLRNEVARLKKGAMVAKSK